LLFKNEVPNIGIMKKSALYPIYEQIQNCSDEATAKQLIFNVLNQQPQTDSIRLMKVRLQHQVFGLDKIVWWTYQNLLAKEGLQVIN